MRGSGGSKAPMAGSAEGRQAELPLKAASPGPVFHPGYTPMQGCCPVFDWATWAEGEEGAWNLPPPFKRDQHGKGREGEPLTVMVT